MLKAYCKTFVIPNLSQKPVGFGQGFRKSGLKPAVFFQAKGAAPKLKFWGSLIPVVFFGLSTANVVLFAAPEDSPLYRFRSETHAAGGHQGRINALVSVTAPVSDAAPVSNAAPVSDAVPVLDAVPATVVPATEASANTATADTAIPDDGENSPEEAADTKAAAKAFADAAPSEDGEKHPAEEVYVLTAGEDGFLGIWRQKTAEAIERYQLSTLPVSMMKAHPVRSEIAYIESDGFAFHRLSVIDYWTKAPLFTLDFEDRINYIDYTAGGSFLVVITGGQNAIQILDSKTGRKAHPDITAQAVFAATSPSERTLVAYSQTGRLSYWNLQTGQMTAEFQAAASLYEPIIFRNYNLLAGWMNNELVVINATNGRTLIRDRTIPRGVLLPVAQDNEKFAISSPSGVTVYAIDDSGALAKDAVLPAVEGSAAVSVADGFFLGTESGTIVHVGNQGDTTAFSTGTHIQVTDALVFDGTLFYVTADGRYGEMPADYEAVLNGTAVTLPEPQGNGPQTARLPVSELSGKLLYLESQGPVVRTAGDPKRELLSVLLPFTIDADFANDENIIVAGILSSGGSLLQLVNITTSETVPIDLPGSIVLKVYRGKSDSVYVAVSEETGRKVRLLKLDIRNPRQSRRLLEADVTDDIFDIAESGGNLVTNMGRTAIGFYDATRGNLLFSGERTEGIPVRILNSGSGVVVVDEEGALVWLDAATGRIQAVMRVYADEWEMSASNGRRANGR
jgi:hypothetical protein